MKKTAIAILVISALILPIFLNSTSVRATVTEPALKLSGTVTKDIIDMQNIWLYTDASGINQTLQYQRDGNISFSSYNIAFLSPFLNSTVAKFSTVVSPLSGDIQLLRDQNYIPYMLFSFENTSALSTSTVYEPYFYASVEKDFNRNYFLLLIVKNITATTAVSFFDVLIKIIMIDEGGENHVLAFRIRYVGSLASSISIVDSDGDGKTDDILVQTQATSNVFVLQKAMSIMEDMLGVSLVKISGFYVHASVKTGTSLVQTYIYKFAIRVLQIFSQEVRIGNTLLNTTTIQINSDSITSSVGIVKIADVQVPFTYELQPDKSFDANSLTAKYDYLFSLPSDPELSFSNVVANFTLGDFKPPAANLTYFYVSGNDYKDTLQAQGYYQWSITPGTQYYVSAKFKLSEDLFDQVVDTEGGPPSFWVDPLGWISYQFWNLVAFAASVLGLTGVAAYAKQQKRQVKAKNKSK